MPIKLTSEEREQLVRALVNPPAPNNALRRAKKLHARLFENKETNMTVNGLYTLPMRHWVESKQRHVSVDKGTYLIREGRLWQVLGTCERKIVLTGYERSFGAMVIEPRDLGDFYIVDSHETIVKTKGESYGVKAESLPKNWQVIKASDSIDDYYLYHKDEVEVVVAPTKVEDDDPFPLG